MKVSRIICFYLLFFVFLLSSCISSSRVWQQNESYVPVNFKPVWKEIASGLDVFRYAQETPPLKLYAMRLDLTDPEREIVITSGEVPLSESDGVSKFYSLKTSSFLEDTDCLVAINGTPFKPYRLIEGRPQVPVGVVISGGIVYSINSKYDTLVIDRQSKIRFYENPFAETFRDDYKDISIAIGGFFIILKNGINIGTKGKRNPLSMIGVSEDENFLYLAVIDGNSDYSIGASQFEGTEWFKWLGAWNGMILDGGGSSTLVIRGEDGKAIILNRPHLKLPFLKERSVPVHIGIR